MTRWKEALAYSLSDGTPRRAFWVALTVGSVLNLINQGDALLGGFSINWWKLILTYLVPYAVSTYGAVSYRMGVARNTRGTCPSSETPA